MTRWCEAGNTHVWLRNNNTIQVCCSLTNKADNTFKLANTVDFLEIMNSAEWKNKYSVLETGPLHNDCQSCTLSERDAGHSQRLKLNDMTYDGKHFFLKIDFSNKCNLKCIMCGSSRSTGWIKDEQKMYGLGFGDEPVSYTKLDDRWWLDIPENWWANLRAVEISGGEPLYQEDAVEFLEFLSDVNPKLHLRIITNLTIFNEKIKLILSKFPQARLLCSVDAWEDHIYEYSRGGIYSLDAIKENIKDLYSIVNDLSIVDTIHCVTYDQAEKGKKWISDNNLDIKHTTNYVYTPRHLDARSVLPEEIFPKGSKDQKLQQYFIKWITALDSVRGTDVLEIRPEFKNWFKEST